MIERTAVWVLSLPLMLGGSAIAHSLAYRIVVPARSERGTLLAETGHAYQRYAPQAIGVAAAILVCALAVRVLARRTGGVAAAVPLAPFAFLPPLAFAVQEHVERFAHDGAMPLGAALQPTFAVGLALQLPFAAVAYLLARLLLRLADDVALTARTGPPRAIALASEPIRQVASACAPAASPLALHRAKRGPPALAPA